MASVLRVLTLAVIAVLGGFAGGVAIGDRTARPTALSTPSIATIAYFRTLDLCNGQQPTSGRIEPVAAFGRKSTDFAYAYRCPDGTAGNAYEGMPLVP